MALIDTLTSSAKTILDVKWDERSGNVIPNTDDVVLKDGAVKIEATFLYADLAGSSILAKKCPWETTAKIIRAYLDISVRLIRANNGEIRSFDGDRVMGIFKGETPNTSAVTCAREIDWMVENVLNPIAKEKFNSIKNNDIKIRHCIGIDTSEARAVRSGIRNNNDLIWIGKAPSFAAKLSDIREYPYAICISKESHSKLPNSAKTSDGQNIWENRNYTLNGETYSIYITKYMLKP